MQDQFNFAHPPFDTLTPEQRQDLLDQTDIAYFARGETLLEPGQLVDCLYIILKGVVEERHTERGEVFAQYTTDDLFDIRGQFDGECRHGYVALEETLCFVLPTQAFLTLMTDNPDFAAWFQQDLKGRQQTTAPRKNLSEFILTRIDNSNIQPAMVIDGQTSILQATRLLKTHHLESLIVAHDGSFGMLTGTDLLYGAVLDALPAGEPVHVLASFNLVSVQKGDFLFNALMLMVQHKIERVAVKEGEQLAGILEMTQLLSQFSTHSQVLGLRILRAETIDELAEAAATLGMLVENLHNNGVRLPFIMKLLASLNGQLMRKAFEFAFPPELHDRLALMVLGSEGRCEQVLKTDQDNALVLDNDLAPGEVRPYAEQFSRHLERLGYPPCPGRVMVNNPDWVRRLDDWQHCLTGWVRRNTPDSHMQLAIIADPHFIAGRESLVRRFQKHLLAAVKGRELLLSEFAAQALRFHTPLTFFGDIKQSDKGLDIKRGGIFPVVQGVRALALEQGVTETNTLERIRLLTDLRIFEPEQADNLSAALTLFWQLRLEQQLARGGDGLSQRLDPARLPRHQRDLLRHALHVVKKFKQKLEVHFQIRSL
ncbi:putative nucleotidyltransferase substrate binding domain-containing protein [Oceanimonas pelagia]|uniref:Nucleotidyltransferase substrate binding domain-containing protein n=1 Tax=Oceanimonas pelagia TaxID=3028314 RepID=A0AA50QB23_9GAMM|nr:putative nucleotidyltransferase substrate binding domain-containing protein [Oceanimonas pelagia]WMC09802.1 putative nucleotidyltransferase substrate binding domain-containing protein [Oceanimonas pelagia]